MTMRGSYKVTSNLESGYGRSDITLESLHRKNPHVIIEFKQGTDLDRPVSASRSRNKARLKPKAPSVRRIPIGFRRGLFMI